MPSDKNPADVVNPGPGRLSAGVATQSAFIFDGGGGGGGVAAALHAHIVDPVDAHMASAIGINPYDPYTFQPILSTVGGTVDGESVMDFITAAKDLWPIPPDRMGWDSFDVANSGRTSWGTLGDVGIGIGEAVAGGFPRGTDVVFTNHIIENTTLDPAVSGMVYPADRGVLAFYHSPNGDFFDPGATLVSALWLGSTAVPAGIPDGSFQETSRHTQQGDHAPAGAGLDYIYLTNRVPYLKDYSSYVVGWTAFEYNFLRYQIATYVQTPDLVIGPGDVGSWLWVHWRESYAVSLAAIQVSQLAANFTDANCYSATQSPDFDTAPCYYVNRHNVYRDTASANAPVLNSSTTGVAGGFPGPSYTQLSGIGHYTGFNLDFTFPSVQLGQMSNSSFLTGSSVPIPTARPFSIDFTDFGGNVVGFDYDDLRKFGTAVNYSASNSPQPADVWEYTTSVFTGAGWGYGPVAAPTNGYGHIKYRLQKPFHDVTVQDSTRYVYNSYPQSGGSTLSTDTFEPFVDEKYRYVSTAAPSSSTLGMLPAGGDDFDSITPFVASGPDAQVIGHTLIYPQVDYSSGYSPIASDYSAVYAGDPASHLRHFIRAFNTGAPRNTGKLRIQGLTFADFEAVGAYTGDIAADHPGGAAIFVRVAGSTEWLDLGRVKGDPDLLLTDFRGCRIGLEVSGSDIIVTYDTTQPTVNNGSGDFPIFVRVTLVKGAGASLTVTELEWQAP